MTPTLSGLVEKYGKFLTETTFILSPSDVRSGVEFAASPADLSPDREETTLIEVEFDDAVAARYEVNPWSVRGRRWLIPPDVAREHARMITITPG